MVSKRSSAEFKFVLAGNSCPVRDAAAQEIKLP